MRSYTVRDIYIAMGRAWVDEGDQFYYPLNPRLRWSDAVVSIMREEWAYWRSRHPILLEDCCIVNARIPRQLAIHMPTDTPQQLLRALNRMREECNRMTMRIRRNEFRRVAEEHAAEGWMEQATLYLSWSQEERLQSDIEMSDDDEN